MQDVIDFAMWVVNVTLWSVIWYCFFNVLAAGWKMLKIFKEAKELEEIMHDKLLSLVHNVKPEKHSDMLYWFDNETDSFLAQGKCIDEIRTHLKERFKQDVFLVEDSMLLIGPDFTPVDISDKTPAEVGKYIADNLLHKLVPTSKLVE
jgi:hypothetical protein